MREFKHQIVICTALTTTLNAIVYQELERSESIEQ